MSAVTLSLVAALLECSRKRSPANITSHPRTRWMAQGTVAEITQLVEKTPLFRAGDSRQFGSKNRPRITCVGTLDSHIISMA